MADKVKVADKVNVVGKVKVAGKVEVADKVKVVDKDQVGDKVNYIIPILNSWKTDTDLVSLLVGFEWRLKLLHLY